MQQNISNPEHFKYFCEFCLYGSNNKSNFLKHISTSKHHSATFGTKTALKWHKIYFLENEQKYYCKSCDYASSKLCNFKKHLSTLKHNSATFKKKVAKSTQLENSTLYACSICNKKYKHKCSVYKHEKLCKKNSQNKKICSVSPKNMDTLCSAYIVPCDVQKVAKTTQNSDICSEKSEPNNTQNLLHKMHCKENIYKDESKKCLHEKKIVMSQREYELSLECSKLKGKLEALQDSKQVVNNTVHYKPVNIHMYLNTRYKDAMNLNEFVDNIKLSNDDLGYIKNNGYINVIGNKLVKELKKISEQDRPIHCINDANNREIYIKEKNNWEKDVGILDKELDKIDKKQLQTYQCHYIDNDEEFLNLIKEISDINNNKREKIKDLLKNELEIKIPFKNR